jgi:hypothetical protein
MTDHQFTSIERALVAARDRENYIAEQTDAVLTELHAHRCRCHRCHAGIAPQLLLVNAKTRRLIVANIQLANDEIIEYPIVALDAGGQVVPAPAGDTYTVTNGTPASLNSVIGTLSAASRDGIPAGSPCVSLNALVATATGITLTVTDSAGLGLFSGAVDIVADLAPKNLGLDVTDPVVQGSQAVPA